MTSAERFPAPTPEELAKARADLAALRADPREAAETERGWRERIAHERACAECGPQWEGVTDAEAIEALWGLDPDGITRLRRGRRIEVEPTPVRRPGVPAVTARRRRPPVCPSCSSAMGREVRHGRRGFATVARACSTVRAQIRHEATPARRLADAIRHRDRRADEKSGAALVASL